MRTETATVERLRVGACARVRVRGRAGSIRLVLCAAVALCALLAPGCATRSCKERLVESKESPDRRHNAAVLVRQCAGEPNGVTHVNLHAGYGTAPPADGDGSVTRGEVFSIDGQRQVNVSWKGAQSLQVECVGCGANQVFKKEPTWEDVQISYAGRD